MVRACSDSSVTTKRVLCFSMSCKPLVCNLLERVAESMKVVLTTISRLTWAAGNPIYLSSLRALLLLRLLVEVFKLIKIDRKVNLLVELHHFDIMSITGISETKWFGWGVYEEDGYVLVHSGKPVSADNEPVQRNEGVGILLSPALEDFWEVLQSN